MGGRPSTIGAGQAERFGGEVENGGEAPQHLDIAQPTSTVLEPGDRRGRAPKPSTELPLGPAEFRTGMAQHGGVVAAAGSVPQSR
ncbi:hypothetical protein JOD54_004413 [Actinokineospora baliensis]|nr:hypothetical protein [Actinokineospora baliensis]